MLFQLLVGLYCAVLLVSGSLSQQDDSWASFGNASSEDLGGINPPHWEIERAFGKVPDANWILNSFEEAKNRRKSIDNNDTEVIIDDESQCLVDLSHVITSLNEKWALEMLDAAGKINSGFFYGAFSWPGNYDECLNVNAPPGIVSKGFSGQYCMLTWTNPLQQILPLSSAICVPNSCNEAEVRKYYNIIINVIETIPFLSKLNETLSLIAVRCLPKSVEWNTSTIIFTTFLGLLVLLVAVATAYELFQRNSLKKGDSQEDLINTELAHDLNGKPGSGTPITSGNASEILLCFSAIRNGAAILDITPRKGQLDCLHGIRFLSMGWVILGHTYLGGIFQMSNVISLVKEMDSFAFMAIIQGTFSVDTFFFLSGFLLAYLFLKDGVRTMKWRDWAYFYIHRYLRLTPTYALVIGMWASIWLYVGSGPWWNPSTGDQNNCQTTWWQNLLYINNIPESKTMCMGWSWYLANDMQFFVISPLFLVPLQRWPIVGCIITGSLLIIQWIATGVISYLNDLNGMVLDDATTRGPTNSFDLIYDKPYTRIGPYLIGVFVAFAYLKVRSRTNQMNKWVLTLGWACSTALCMVTVFGPYRVHMSVLTSAFYSALSRSSFTLGVGWIVFACLTGHGGPVNWFLSWRIWFPLSRLTYCAYLIHLFIITWYFSGMKYTFYFSHSTLVLIYLAVLMLAYAGAFLVSLILEAPFIVLEKHLRTKQKQR